MQVKLKRLVPFVVLLFVVMALQGCASAQIESRDALLRQIRQDLADKIGPRFKAATQADPTLLPEQKEADCGLVDDTISAIDAVAPPVVPQ